MLRALAADEGARSGTASFFTGINTMSHLWQAIRTGWVLRAAVVIADLSTAHCAPQAGHW
jgi:hypothetical protein